MFSSIRYKLLFFMSINIIIFALLLSGANTIFARKYYTENKKSILKKTSNEIENIIKDKNISSGNYDDSINYEINRLERSIGGVAVIGELDGTIYYPNDQDINRPVNKDNPFFIIDKNLVRDVEPPTKQSSQPKNDVIEWEAINSKSFFIKLQDPHLKIETLRFQTDLGNGVMLLLWVPIDQISETVAVSNTFTKIITALSILITGFLGIFLSKTFTRPITEMSIIAKKMSEFDFSQTLQISGKDEIAELSQSINHLSMELDSKISQLDIKNQQLKDEIAHERKLDQTRKEFVSNVSHELKTPIFLIQGYAEGLKANISNSEEKRNFYCDVIMEESDKMDILVKDLLNLAELESGIFSVNRIDFDIVILIEEIINKMKTIFEEKSIILEMHADKHFIVNADPMRIEQIMMNYLNNAINHLDEKKKIRITVNQDNKKGKVLVYNSGKPIPEEALDKIWNGFYKVDKARTREYGGTGLGLSIVEAIQKVHGNKYGVHNVEDGVEFWFDINLKNTDTY